MAWRTHWAGSQTPDLSLLRKTHGAQRVLGGRADRGLCQDPPGAILFSQWEKLRPSEGPGRRSWSASPKLCSRPPST